MNSINQEGVKGYWDISKQFDFCYGHRVWSQKLNSEFSLDSCLACRHLHGHQGTILIHLASSILEDGMVTDFKHLNWFKKWLDDVLDHKFVLDWNDPLVPYEVDLNHFGPENFNFLDLLHHHPEGHKTLKLELLASNIPQALREKYEGMVFVQFVPTSENLSKWLLDIVVQKMSSLPVTVKGIEFFETPKSASRYTIL